MKFLVVWWWTPEHAKEVTERFRQWKPKGNWKALYPISTMVGRNKGFCVVECTEIAEANKDVREWTDICTYEIIPIMDSREAIA